MCSGIEAASCAWHSLGWTPVAFSEIEPFPSALLAHRFPNVPNLGDMTKFKEWPDDLAPNILVGGTPCQSFSVAGLRKGLDDPRGNLMLTYLGIADKYKPEYLCWENVPGVLSSNGGRDFGTFLGALGKLGYGFAYRVLDAQYVRTFSHNRAVPQRRRRVFVVGCLGNWRRAAAILFDIESVCRNPPPRREAGQSVAHDVAGSLTSSGRGVSRAGDTRGQDPVIAVRDVSPTITQNYGKQVDSSDTALGPNVVCMSHGQANAEISVGFAPTLNCNHEQPIALVGNTIGRLPHNGGNGTGFDQSGTMCTLTKTDVHAVAFAQNTRDEVRLIGGDGSHVGALSAQPGMKQTSYVAQAISWSEELTAHSTCAGTMQRGGDGGRHEGVMTPQMRVRRLTPLECERLQGFPTLHDYVTIAVCSDRQKNPAPAGNLNHKLPNAAGSAEKNPLKASASSAENLLQENLLRNSKPVEVIVGIFCEDGTMQLHIPAFGWKERARIAERNGSTFLATPHGDFAQKIVAMLTSLGKTPHLGRVGEPPNSKHFPRLKNGQRCVELFGQEIDECVGGAEANILSLINDTKFTTSGVGSNSQNCVSTSKILSCFVANAMNSCIPERMLWGNSYEIKIDLETAYTNIPGASDTVRYRALGNSMAVNVMNAIGTRINETR